MNKRYKKYKILPENKILSGIQARHTVIATGGSAVLKDSARLPSALNSSPGFTFAGFLGCTKTIPD